MKNIVTFSIITFIVVNFGTQIHAESYFANFRLIPIPQCQIISAEFKIVDRFYIGPLYEKCDADHTNPVFEIESEDIQLESEAYGVISTFTLSGSSEGWGGAIVLEKEQRKIESTQGSKAEASAILASFLVGYQWIWSSGFNVFLGGGFDYIGIESSQKEIEVGEPETVKNDFDENLKSKLFATPAIALGWAF